MSFRAIEMGPRIDEVYRSLGLTVLLVSFFLATVVLFGPAPKVYGLLPAIAVALLMVANLEFAFVVLIASLFIDAPISWFPLSVWVSFPVFLSVFWRFRNVTSWDISTPLTRSIVVYGLTVLPSLLVTTVPLFSAYRLLNVAAFLVLLYGSIMVFRQKERLVALVGLYLFFTVVNSLDVILEAVLLQRRSYGFTGVMFVDFSAMAVCIAATLAVTTRGWKRYLAVFVSGVSAVALVLTQTRNPWISAALTLAVLSVLVLRRPDLADLSRGSVVRLIAIGAVFLGLSAGVAFALNPGVQERTADIAQTTEDRPAVSGGGVVSNSLVSRLLIWSTAYNAFAEHPLTGVGVYAFPFVSREYSSIHPLLYRKYVQNLTPHQTYFAVLAETGIIGFAGYTVFVITVVRLALRSLKRIQDPERRRIGLVAVIAVAYAVISMAFTDAWLWGPLIVVLGLILGAMIANEKADEHERDLVSA